MSSAGWERLKELFGRALERDPAEREALLSEEARNEPELAAEVRDLLEAHEKGGGLLEEILSVGGGDLLEAPQEPSAGSRLGPWELLETIGHGGMGEVFLARRAGEPESLAVIKLVRPGLFSPESLLRFRVERQALANLQHPGTARLLDGGSTAQGVPYFVMEYVEGVPIDQYADARGLSIAQRIRLVREVCDAVAFAHRNLILHRDLKPTNILVTESGQTKLLDFGIAKFLDEAEAGASPAGERLLTSEFASPEQIRGEAVTTASDIYSLGVLLYRLLSGGSPYRAEEAGGIAKAIGEQQPTLPSTAVARGATRGEASSVDAARRSRRLRGDLDSIVLKALRKEPERRYGSVGELSEDLRRHLDGEPVLAREERVAYRASKFFRRHRLGSVAAALAAAALVAALVVSLREAAVARREARKAERVQAFVQSVLGAPSPWREGRDVTVAEALGRAERRIQTELAGEAEIEAGVRHALGETWAGLGLYERAERELLRSLELSREAYGDGHEEVARALDALARVRTSRGDAVAAEPPAREALEIRRARHGEEHPAVAAAWTALGSVLHQKREDGEAEAAHRRALAIYRARGGAPTVGLAKTLNDLGVTLRARGDAPGAEAFQREALQTLRAVHPGPHPDVASAMTALASVVWDTRRDRVEAEHLYREALTMRRKVLGERHLDVVWTLYNYANMLMEAGDPARAEGLARESLSFRGTSLPDSHPLVASALQVAGRCRLARGDPRGAEPLLRESLFVRRAAMPPGDWQIAIGESVLGECLAAQRRFPEAERLLLSGAEALREKLGKEHPRAKEAARRVAALYDSWGRPGEAKPWREAAR